MQTANSPRNHVLKIPFFVSIILVFQFIFALVLLGLSAYGVSQLYVDGFGATLFTSIVTMIITAYILVATEIVTLIYNYWAILGLDIFLVVMWLISFAITASNSSGFDSAYDFLGGFYNGFTYDGFNFRAYRNVLRACAVFGAFEFVLFIVTLGFTAVYLYRHRTAGGHCTPNPNNVAGNVEMKRGSTGAVPQEQVGPVQETPSAWV